MLSEKDFLEKQIVICFTMKGHKISFKNDNIIIKDSEENTIMQASCHRIFAVWIIGPVTITSGIMERSRKFGFSICLMNYNHKLYGLLNSSTEGNFLLRRKQYSYNSLDIPKHLIRNKIFNQIELLSSMRQKTLFQKEVIKDLKSHIEQLENVEELTSLLGIEGSASRIFFSNWFADMPWKGRKPRAKVDIINTTLDIGYTYLFYLIESMLNLYGFDLYQGTLHKCFYQRKSLVCDLVEPFRCIVDKQVRKAYSLKQLKPSDFREYKGQYFLKTEKNKEYSFWIMEGILNYKSEMFRYVRDYYRAFIRGKSINQYPFFKINGE
ncbi:MAG: type V CRISPR-associated endonuclease Cas1 [Ignavibacteria bacterium]|nr:type V CRISPR-associated endonuclease Cas1 [Ignavibacteria bacterium]